MPRRQVSVTLPDIERCAGAVREVVAAYRRTGLKRAHAQEQAAADLGLTGRRVAAYVYGEVFTVCPAEAARIAAGFLAHLDREAATLTARAAQVTARRASLSPSPSPTERNSLG